MHDAFFDYIRARATTPLTEENVEMLRTILVPRKFRKRQYFLQAGEVCDFGGFIVKGAMRQYSVDEKGTEHVLALLLENWWVGDRESFRMGTPSTYYIDAWEPSEVLVISKKDFSAMQSVPAFSSMEDALTNRHVVALERRLSDQLTLSAEQRYEKLIETYPEFLQRFPQHLIASYLGMTKETLSRIRHQAAKE
jgi:CRP-like cAMP-binding protein